MVLQNLFEGDITFLSYTLAFCSYNLMFRYKSRNVKKQFSLDNYDFIQMQQHKNWDNNKELFLQNSLTTPQLFQHSLKNLYISLMFIQSNVPIHKYQGKKLIFTRHFVLCT